MFVRNGQALGSILRDVEPRAERPKPKQTKKMQAQKGNVTPEPEAVKDDGTVTWRQVDTG